MIPMWLDEFFSLEQEIFLFKYLDVKNCCPKWCLSEQGQVTDIFAMIPART